MSQPPSPETLRDKYAALPTDAQQTVAAFVAFLARQSPRRPKSRPKPRVPFRQDPAFEMWRDRPEMEDSLEYVRRLRGASPS